MALVHRYTPKASPATPTHKKNTRCLVGLSHPLLDPSSSVIRATYPLPPPTSLRPSPPFGSPDERNEGDGAGGGDDEANVDVATSNFDDTAPWGAAVNNPPQPRLHHLAAAAQTTPPQAWPVEARRRRQGGGGWTARLQGNGHANQEPEAMSRAKPKNQAQEANLKTAYVFNYSYR